MKGYKCIGAVLVFLLGIFATAAWAQSRDCDLDGVTFPHGAVVGSLRCVDGTWVRIR